VRADWSNTGGPIAPMEKEELLSLLFILWGHDGFIVRRLHDHQQSMHGVSKAWGLEFQRSRSVLGFACVVGLCLKRCWLAVSQDRWRIGF
jgi:hypothetical protein